LAGSHCRLIRAILIYSYEIDTCMSLPFPLFPDGLGKPLTSKILRGATVDSPEGLQAKLREAYPSGFKQKHLLKIGEIEIPSDLESYGFFYIGAPGTGKSQTIFSNVSSILKRKDFRAIILDTNGEILTRFYDPDKFLIFAPWDERSVFWSHRTEQSEMELIADSLIPDSLPDPFWSITARQLLAGIYEICETNEEVYDLMNQEFDYLAKKVPYMSWLSSSEKTAGSVVAVMKSHTSFYKTIKNEGTGFSFFEWGAGNDRRSLIIPLFADRISRYRSLITMAIRQALKGLLTRENERKVKTAVIIDEMGSLYRLDEIFSILAQGRKFKTAIIGASQTLAQLEQVYGKTGVETLLQTVKTKLILSCPDYSSASQLTQLMGRQEMVRLVRACSPDGLVSESEFFSDIPVVHPTEVQLLPPLKGYIHIGGFPTALTNISLVHYQPKVEPQILCTIKPRNVKTNEPQISATPSLSQRYFASCHKVQLQLVEKLLNHAKDISTFDGKLLDLDDSMVINSLIIDYLIFANADALNFLANVILLLPKYLEEGSYESLEEFLDAVYNSVIQVNFRNKISAILRQEGKDGYAQGGERLKNRLKAETSFWKSLVQILAELL